jgi:protein phosphatase
MDDAPPGVPVMESTRLDGFGQPVIDAAVAGRTHPGQRRSENQDNFLIGDLTGADDAVLLRGDTSGAAGGGGARLTTAERGALLVVADGMGGAAAGRLASGLVCTFVLTELQESWSVDRDNTPRRFAFRLREAVERANARIHQHAQRHPECLGMGSTATIAGLLDGFLYLAQVGDSRGYLVRSGFTTQITRDQSLVQQMLDAGAITVEAAEQSAHGNVILQALGVEPKVAVDLTYLEVRRGDFLLLCSDGLHRMVRPEEIAAAVGRLADPDAVCEELVALANERGGPDNITAVAALFAGSGLQEPRADDVVRHTAFEFPDSEGV